MEDRIWYSYAKGASFNNVTQLGTKRRGGGVESTPIFIALAYKKNWKKEVSKLLNICKNNGVVSRCNIHPF